MRIYASQVEQIGSGNQFVIDDAIKVEAEYLTNTSYFWKKQICPYFINGNLNLGSSDSTTMTIEAGTILLFEEYSSLSVGLQNGITGTLIAQGTSQNPVVFTSAQKGQEAAGDWEGIKFGPAAGSETKLDYCQVSYGGNESGQSGNINFLNTQTNNISVTNCTLSNSLGYGIYIKGSNIPEVSSNTYTSNASGDNNF
jgi:parallel beta-helix repeat protein